MQHFGQLKGRRTPFSPVVGRGTEGAHMASEFATLVRTSY